MDDEERQKKVEAGKAKLASFRKKKTSKKKKNSETPSSTPRDDSHSEEIGAGDSIAVQTGDDNSVRALSPSDESDRSTTTAEDITTEEEGGYALGLTPIERIEELELTVSDQQEALKKLTLENKSLRDKNEAAMMRRALEERDSVISDLRDSVTQSSQHVRHLQQQLTKATDAVIDTGGEQGQILAELAETKQKLDLYQNAIVRQEEAMMQMAQKLEEKSLEAGEAMDRCHSLQQELDRSQSMPASSEDNVSGAVRTLEEELKREKGSRHELELQHEVEIASWKEKVERLKAQQMEDQRSSGGYDPEDLRAYREQVALLQSQLETAYRDIDKMKRDHDKEVIHLNQQLVGTVDEYETKLQEERTMAEELEQKLEMSDTVSSEIQASFSKQLEQLEEERDALRQQLRQTQARAKENSTSKTQVKSLEEEVLSYQTELAETSERLEEAEKKRRHLRDEVERAQEALEKVNNEKSKLQKDYDDLNLNFNLQKEQLDELNKAIEENFQQMEIIAATHENEVFELKAQNANLIKASDEERAEREEKMKTSIQEHTEELKNLHSQHHRQMEELKREMESQLNSTKSGLDEARKEQLENVKDVHERNRDRELARLKEDHKDEVESLLASHHKEIEAARAEEREVQALAQERLRIELQEEFSGTLENELSILRRSLEQENDLAQAEMVERHLEELSKMKFEHEEALKTNIQEELEEQQAHHESELLRQKKELDDALEEMKKQFEEAQEVMALEHSQSLAKMEVELEEIHARETARSSDVDSYVKKIEVDLQESKDANANLEHEISELLDKLKSQKEELEDEYLSTLTEEKEKYEKEVEEKEEQMKDLKEELTIAQNERDQIFAQAEESQKRLAALHHEEGIRMQEDIDQLEASHQEKVEQMQYEIESLRTSRNDLQDLRSQLMARNASVEEISRMREEFAEEKEHLLKDQQENERNIREAHQQEVKSYEEKLEALRTKLAKSEEELEEIVASPAQVESSPMRSLSQLSDYDSSNVVALNKDYRSAMTLTNVADVSGLSDNLQKPLEQQESEEKSSSHSSSSHSSSSESSSSEDEVEKAHSHTSDVEEEAVEVVKEVEELKKQLEKAEAELESLKIDHEEAMENLNKEHSSNLENLKAWAEAEIKKMEDARDQVVADLQQSHDDNVEKLKENHQKEIVQIRLQCASDTELQVEQECSVVREQMKSEFQSEMDSIKHQMEVESSEKLERERSKHAEELEEQSNKLSSSMEVRISAVMSELHEQKQEALQKASSEHNQEIRKLREDFEEKMRKASLHEEEAMEEWKRRKEELERDVERLGSDFQRSKEDYQKLTNDLDSGSNEYLQTLQTKHEEDLERLRKRLEEEHEERQEQALKKQAIIYKQAQADFVKLHEEQMERFVSGQKEDAQLKEKEIARMMEELKQRLLQEYNHQTKTLEETHNEEIKAVATKLVEVDEENQDLKESKNNLLHDLEELQLEKAKELAEMKTTLVNQHMVKFQEVTANLDQLHKEETEKLVQQHQEEESRLHEELASTQEKIELLESNLKMREVMISEEEFEKKMEALKEDHEEEMKKLKEEHDGEITQLQDEHDTQLQQIAEEIQKQDEAHKANMEEVLSSQSGGLKSLQKQFDEALTKATEASLLETQKMSERIVELETELEASNELAAELKEIQNRNAELESLIEDIRAKTENFESDRNDEREAYEKKLTELSEAFSSAREEQKDMTAQIEFERAEYEAEIESVQEDLRNKDENIKELEAEVEHKSAAMDSLVKQQEVLSERRDREAQEGGNLLKMLRDDLERINRERDNTVSANEQLLSVLSDLVRANHRCEEMIVRRLENLPIMGGEEHSEASHHQDLSPRDESVSSTTPLTTSLTGSFVDEGLDLSQRLAESMFVGPELDPAARDTVAGAGVRVGQAAERLFDMLDSTIKQLNDSRKAQNELGDELLRVVNAKEDRNNNGIETSEESERLLLQIAKLEEQISEQEKELEDARSKRASELEAKEESLHVEYAKLDEERSLLRKQKEALSEGRDDTELNLLRATEELANEKQLLIERHQAERMRLEDAAHQLEVAMEEEAKITEDKEASYLAQIEDLTSQIDALTKQTESGNRFAAEMTTDREAERDQFEKELEAMRSEIDQTRGQARVESAMAGKVSLLEEELEASQQALKDANTEAEKLKETLHQQEQLLEELQERVKENEDEDSQQEIAIMKAQLEESKRQEDALQKELCDSILRVSALEAQLDRYRHGVDEDALAALERAEAEERQMKEQGLQELEAKEAEIEHLVEQQNSLRTQLIEKEEEVEKLLHSMEDVKDLESENLKLKEELQMAEENLSEVPAPSTQSEQLEALSRHLLEEKNAEIDDLRRKVALLQRDGVDDSSQELPSLEERVHELTSENESLRQQLHEAEERLHEVLQEVSFDVASPEQEILHKDPSHTDEDTGIQDLTAADLTQRASSSQDDRLVHLEDVNLQLRQRLNDALEELEDLRTQIGRDTFNLPSTTKEKIRDLEERLEKEKDASSSSHPSSSDEDSDAPEDRVVSFVLSHTNVTDETKKPTTSKDSNIIREKLMEIEEELKSNPSTVLGRILHNKDEAITSQQGFVQRLETCLNNKQDEITTLTKQVSDLEHELNEPDVRIRMQGSGSGVDAVKMEELESSCKEDDTSYDSSSTSESSSSHLEEDSESDRSSSDDTQPPLQDNAQELKMLLDAKEKEVKEDKTLIEEKDQIIRENEEKLLALQDQLEQTEAKISQLEKELHLKSEELEAHKVSEEVEASSHPDDVIKLREELNEMTKKIATAQQERILMSKQLDDIQRECSSLLEDNRALEEGKRILEQELVQKTSAIEEQEKIAHEKEDEMRQARADSETLQLEVEKISNELDSLKAVKDNTPENTDKLHLEIEKLREERDKLHHQVTASSSDPPLDGASQHPGGSGDAARQKQTCHASLILPSELESAEIARLAEEIGNLNFKNEELEIELETLKQSHIDECESLVQRHEKEVTRLEDQLNQYHESTRIEEVPLELEEVHSSYAMQLTRIPSTESKSSVEDIESKIGELKREHQQQMEEIKNKYAEELHEAVVKATKEQEEQNKKRFSEMEEKHRREMNEILSESITGDSELALRLRSELDLADELDNKLIDQLKSVAHQGGQPIEVEEEPSSHASSPGREAEISSRLQKLLSRLHKEGVQVLSLSELQFLKQHQQNRNVSMNTDAESNAAQPAVDVEGLKLAWESEKLALLDAIQALKELLTQTAADAAAPADDDESLRWRAEFLRSIADLFEREKRASLAELRASVIEAHGEADLNNEIDAASRLEALERKIRNQEMHHRSELERLLAADRDQLIEDVKQLKVERKQKLDGANERIQQLQDHCKTDEANSRATINQLHNQLECVKSKLQQEEALTSDLMTSLETEKQRSRGLLPALQKERDRTLELTGEITTVSEDYRRQAMDANQQIESMRDEIDALTKAMEQSKQKINALQQEIEAKEEEVLAGREKQEQIKEEREEEIANLQAALATEENRRKEAMKAVDVERNNVSGLHQELASERATAYQEVVQLKNRCDDLTAAVQAGKERCSELQDALEREVTVTRHARVELENERKMTSEAREHDRATVADLQAILEDARKETERVQRRVVAAEQEREEAMREAEENKTASDRRLEEERSLREEAIAIERKARLDLHAALESEKLRKQDAQSRVHELEERQKDLRDEVMMSSSREAQETLLARRRQLESLRQRLQLETSKLQNLVDRTAHRSSPRDYTSLSPSSSVLSSDGEKFESLKRSLKDMQGELKELYAGLTLPDRSEQSDIVRPLEFNDRLLKQNAELSNYAAEAAREMNELREVMAELQEGRGKTKLEDVDAQSTSQSNQQKMAARMQKLYTRYLRAESFRKSLVYQKKYLLLLLGGFQDCEEATLALIARMGAYPSNDALQRSVTHRSAAFTRFRSAARVVVAVCRLKFLVLKSHRAGKSVSAAIQSKHGIRIPSSTSVNGETSGSRYAYNASRTPSPHLEPTSRFAAHRDDHYPYSRYSNEQPSRDSSPYGSRPRPSTSPFLSSTLRSSHPHSHERDRSYGSHNGYSPAALHSYAGLDRTNPGDSDPSLNEYIQKLENIQQKLKYPR